MSIEQTSSPELDDISSTDEGKSQFSRFLQKFFLNQDQLKDLKLLREFVRSYELNTNSDFILDEFIKFIKLLDSKEESLTAIYLEVYNLLNNLVNLGLLEKENPEVICSVYNFVQSLVYSELIQISKLENFLLNRIQKENCSILEIILIFQITLSLKNYNFDTNLILKTQEKLTGIISKLRDTLINYADWDPDIKSILNLLERKEKEESGGEISEKELLPIIYRSPKIAEIFLSQSQIGENNVYNQNLLAKYKLVMAIVKFALSKIPDIIYDAKFIFEHEHLEKIYELIRFGITTVTSAFDIYRSILPAIINSDKCTDLTEVYELIKLGIAKGRFVPEIYTHVLSTIIESNKYKDLTEVCTLIKLGININTQTHEILDYDYDISLLLRIIQNNNFKTSDLQSLYE